MHRKSLKSKRPVEYWSKGDYTEAPHVSAEAVGLRFAGACVVDFGAFSTKVVVAGEAEPRAVVRTPPEVQRVLHCSDETETSTLAKIVCSFLHEVATRSGLLVGAVRTTVLLVHGDRSAIVDRVALEWLREVSSSRLVISMSTAVAVPNAVGARCAIVLDIGFSGVRAVPIVYGVPAMEAAVCSSRGTQSAIRSMRNQFLQRQRDMPDAQRITFDFAPLLTDRLIGEYLLAYGTVAPNKEGSDRWHSALFPLCAKTAMLFGSPSIALETMFGDSDEEALTAPRCVQECWQRCHPQLVRPLIQCLVVVGGGSRFPNAKQRIAAELEGTVPLSMAMFERDESIMAAISIADAAAQGCL